MNELVNPSIENESIGIERNPGSLVKNLSGDLAYFSFKPVPLPPYPPIEVSGELLSTLIEANRKVAFLDAISDKIPNQNLFLSMYIRKEALVSSQIEGTQCTLDDVLDPNAEENANIDVGEVINYIVATDYALDRLHNFPLCMRLLKETHAVLMQGVRGSDKTPGEFRTSQNWIGGQGSTIKNARYIPPNPNDMKDCLDALEKYINSQDTLDPLIQAALIHYQFETIHPFLDGNGRIGRLLITLFLIEKRIIAKPVLYISCFLKLNRVEYYDRLSEVRKKGDYEQWIIFFLQMIRDTATDAIEAIDELERLHKKNATLLESVPLRTRENALSLFEYVEKSPIIDTTKTARELGLSYNTTAKNIDLLCKNGILAPTSRHGKAHLFSYVDYLNILRKGTEL